MNCAQCGHEMEKTEGTHRYLESGLKNVILVGVPIYRCAACRETEVEIPAMEELHLLLAFLIILQPTRLTADEIRFLRSHLGYSQDDLATKLGVSRVSVARWETGKTVTLDQEKHLRRFYVEKKKDELKKLPEVHSILSTLIDSLPLEGKKQRKIHRDDWVPKEQSQLCMNA